MKFRPLYDRILVERVESEEVTKGGIILPDTAKEKPQQGKIIAVGSGQNARKTAKLFPWNSKQATQFFSENIRARRSKIEGIEYLIMREDDVLGLVES